MEEDECGGAARLFAHLRCVDHLGEAKASRVFSSNEKECIFMSEPNANAIKTPSRPATNVRTITSLAMLAAIAYVVLLLSKMLPQVSGFLQMDLKDTVICIGAFLFGPLSAAVISIVVAVVEELFWRGYLMRFLVNPDHPWKVPFGTHSWKAYWITTLCFMAVHQPVDYCGAFIYGSLAYLLAVWQKNLCAVIVMHAVANALLGWAALEWGKCGLW